MANIQNVLVDLSRWVANECDISDIIEKHNKGLSADDYAFTMPVDNKDSFGKLKDLFNGPAGYGTRVTVQQASQRDSVVKEIWDTIEKKKGDIIKHYHKTFKENDIKADVEEFKFDRVTKFSDGSRSIVMDIQETKANGEPKSNLTSGFVIYAKGLRQDKGDPHELMTGTLIAMGKDGIVNVKSINSKGVEKRNAELEEWGTKIYKDHKKVKGFNTKEAKLIEGDVVNLAKAISVSNYVGNLLDKNNAKDIVVYQTGAKWSADIKKFKGKDKAKDTIIKAYNSSDLIVKFNLGQTTHHWGLSLKKKGLGVRESDPTLLNKPVVGEAGGKKTAGYLFLKANTADKKALLQKEEQFWKGVYKIRFGKAATGGSWKKNLNNALGGDEKKAALTGKRGTLRETKDFKYPQNTFFLEIDRVFRKVMKDDNNFKEFLDLCFRIDIQDYVNQENFHFSLITGAGGIGPDGKLTVLKPNEKSSAFLKQVFSYMFEGGKTSIGKFNAEFKLDKTKNKIQAFDPQGRATAAKLFYTMWIDKLRVVDIEVRYKGSITVNPQFQVFITRRFDNFLKQAQRKLDKVGIHAYLPKR
jgi:hypothetical protein